MKTDYKDLEICFITDYLTYSKIKEYFQKSQYDVFKDQDKVYFKLNLYGYAKAAEKMDTRQKIRLVDAITMICKVDAKTEYPRLLELQSEIDMHPNVKLINNRNREIAEIYLKGLTNLVNDPVFMKFFECVKEKVKF